MTATLQTIILLRRNNKFVAEWNCARAIISRLSNAVHFRIQAQLNLLSTELKNNMNRTENRTSKRKNYRIFNVRFWGRTGQGGQKQNRAGRLATLPPPTTEALLLYFIRFFLFRLVRMFFFFPSFNMIWYCIYVVRE